MVEKKAGKIPVNARITIDYSKAKPKIKFSYPRKDAVKQNEGGFIIIISLILVALFFFLMLGLTFWNSEHLSYPEKCDFEVRRLNYTIETPNLNMSVNWTIGFQVKCDNGVMTNFSFVTGKKFDNPLATTISQYLDWDPHFYRQTYELRQVALFLFIIMGGIFMWVSFNKFLTKLCVKWGWFKKKMPYINKVIYGKGYYKKFKDCPPSGIIELPLFNNIHLDYHAKGDFAKYLRLFEIKDHPFQYGRLKDFRKKKKKGKKNIMLWRARFYFTEIPKEGSLEIFFT